MKRNDRAERVTEEYLRAVGKELSCSVKHRKTFLDELRESVLLYAAGNEECTAEDLSREFGAPKEIAQSFISQSLPAELKKHIIIKRCAVAILAVFAVVMIVLCAIYVIDTWSFNHGYFVKSEIVEGPFDPYAGADEHSYIEVY